MTDIVKLYNPANSASLTQADIEGLQKLTSDQIKELAAAYPNSATHRAYLLAVDTSKPGNQLPFLSTFQNLWNLREKSGLRKIVAWNFQGNYKPRPTPNVKARRSEVLDLSDTELLTLPGFKLKDHVESETQVKVTKVKKAGESKTVADTSNGVTTDTITWSNALFTETNPQ